MQKKHRLYLRKAGRKVGVEGSGMRECAIFFRPSLWSFFRPHRCAVIGPRRPSEATTPIVGPKYRKIGPLGFEAPFCVFSRRFRAGNAETSDFFGAKFRCFASKVRMFISKMSGVFCRKRAVFCRFCAIFDKNPGVV